MVERSGAKRGKTTDRSVDTYAVGRAEAPRARWARNLLARARRSGMQLTPSQPPTLPVWNTAGLTTSRVAPYAPVPFAPCDPASGSRTGGARCGGWEGQRGECWARACIRGFSGGVAPHTVCDPRSRVHLKSSSMFRIQRSHPASRLAPHALRPVAPCDLASGSRTGGALRRAAGGALESAGLVLMYDLALCKRLAVGRQVI